MEILEKVLQFIIGIVFVFGGGYIAKSSLDAKNMIEAALFGLLGVMVGFFLIMVVFCGAPSGVGTINR